jgi:septum formation protein
LAANINRAIMASEILYLASASPRRRELLEQIGVAFELKPVAVDESRQPNEAARDYVLRLARAKAEAAWALVASAKPGPVLAADTAVVADGSILGKPRDRADALAMLEQLSARTHDVLTAVALRSAHGIDTRVNVSRVTLRAVHADEAERYWRTGEPCDKAGAYAIQGYAAVFIAALEGSYSGVMGLPLFETAGLLTQAGVRIWTHRPES